jgi:hypothetical protein
MKELDITFKKDGFLLKQIARKKDWAVYEQTKGGKVASYELIHILIAPAAKIYGREYPERESYPGNEMWGLEAFTIKDKETAIERLNNLVK